MELFRQTNFDFLGKKWPFIIEFPSGFYGWSITCAVVSSHVAIGALVLVCTFLIAVWSMKMYSSMLRGSRARVSDSDPVHLPLVPAQ